MPICRNYGLSGVRPFPLHEVKPSIGKRAIGIRELAL